MKEKLESIWFDVTCYLEDYWPVLVFSVIGGVIGGLIIRLLTVK